MQQAAVPDIDFGRFDKTLADVGMPGGEAAHQQEIHQQVQVAIGRLRVHTQVAGELGGVEQAPLVVGEHGPETPQGLGGDAGAELGDVPFQVGADEILAPAQAAGEAAGQQAVGEAAPQPQLIQGAIPHFHGMEGAQLQVGDASRQGFA
ncbi:hypothetical protein GALL_543880 [mine drainage metagenome]|uniref:Uncharacterized protein n=1 Tax=mine drainage metagenome TaxID=410659 RepID=A0A1J5P0I9_9ZZZZ